MATTRKCNRDWQQRLSIGLPEQKSPILILRDAPADLTSSHVFYPPQVAREKLGVLAPVIALYHRRASAGTVAHECLHFAQWAVRKYGATRILRWLHLEQENFMDDRLSRHDEAEAYLMEHTTYRVCEAVRDHAGLVLEPFSIVQIGDLIIDFNLGGENDHDSDELAVHA